MNYQLTVLFNADNDSIWTCNGLQFHRSLLLQYTFFKELLENNHNNHNKSLSTDMHYSHDTLLLFKKWLYNQDIDVKELYDMTDQTCQEIMQLSKNVNITFYDDLRLHMMKCVLASDDFVLQYQYYKLFVDNKNYVKYNKDHVKDKNEDKNITEYKFKLSHESISTLNNEDLYDYAYCLEVGICCDKDEKQAFEIYHKLSNDNHKLSMHNYAYCVFHGIGCKSDHQKAFELYKSNWEEHNIYYSLYNYARCLLHGYGCKKDELAAFTIFQNQWEKHKCSLFLFYYAYCLENGHGCTTNHQKACELYKKNWDEHNNSHGLHNYAYCLMSGIGCDKDEKQAFKLFEYNWIYNKDYHSLHNCVWCLTNGVGCDKDLDKALELKKNLSRLI